MDRAPNDNTWAASLDPEEGDSARMSAPSRPVLRASHVVRWLSERVAEHAGVPVASIDPRASFASYGLDSAAAVSLAGDLEAWLGTTIDATALFEYPSIERLAEALTTSP